MTTCLTPGCPNPPAPKRRICTACRLRQKGAAAKRGRAVLRERSAARPGHYGCNPTCPMWVACRGGRLWLGVLPCETLLEDEVGMEYEPGRLTLWPAVWGMG